uniref:AlNc14C213G8955 protein n=1 Tax=Albugo laibachii Nc14 TaxID=890382 RepID=F0WRF2_9STRA|nr:AlNc14C213G8955 [Albugo laibachii Nc14]|eukprot:CCA23915.1 AlNc14C213G8955 [Albugo laibachii Nc14]
MKLIISSADPKDNSAENLEAAAPAYAPGANIGRVRKKYPGVSERTIRHPTNLLKKGVAQRKPGPPPILREKLEGDFRDWVVEMQKNGLTFNWETVLVKDNDAYWVKYGVTRITASSPYCGIMISQGSSGSVAT